MTSKAAKPTKPSKPAKSSKGAAVPSSNDDDDTISCLTPKELKALARPEFSANPDQFYPTKTLRSLGFERSTCSNCGNNYWKASEKRLTCGDSNCEKKYTFIGKGTGRGDKNCKNYQSEKLTYSEAWNGFKRSLTSARVPCTAIPRYPVVARWRADVDYVAAGIYCFQPYVVTGEIAPPANPLICPQFCLRFNDLDNIGITGRHFSGFIMLGIQVFNKPNEYKFWMNECVEFNFRWLTEELGIPKEEITFIEDVWAGGGNLGPSIEYFVGGLELGNMVFMQYKTFPDGSREPLQVQVIDVGIGLERVPWLINGSPTSYHDVFPSALDYLTKELGINLSSDIWEKFGPLSCLLNVDEVSDLEETWKYIAQQCGISDWKVIAQAIEPVRDLYVICDHTRSVLMAIQDGSLPSNIGGGSNVRIILRRTFALLKKRGWWDKLQLAGFFKIFDCHRIDLSKIFGKFHEYPSFNPIIELEYNRWCTTDDEQNAKLEKLLTKRKGEKLTVEDWIVCVTSHGIPADAISNLTNQPIPGNLWYEIDQKQQKSMKKQPIVLYNTAHLPETLNLYYNNHHQYKFDAKILEIMYNVQQDNKPNIVVLDQSSFYPTSGGQEHDCGELTIQNKTYNVIDCIKVGPCVLHILDESLPNSIDSYKGMTISGLVDSQRRSILRNHHTATHIIFASCRRVLGPHVWQNGAKKTTQSAHLDITHFQSLTHEQVLAIQAEANKIVSQGQIINKGFMDKDIAETKYGFHLYQGGVVPGNKLRIVSIENTDTEACCGTHADSTSEVGMIKIIKTGRISDGIVRLYYVAQSVAFEIVNKESELLNQLTTSWGVSQDDLLSTASRFFNGYKKYGNQASKQTTQIIQLQIQNLLLSNQLNRIVIKSNETNPTVYLSSIQSFAQKLKSTKKSIIFVADTFIHGLIGESNTSIEKELFLYCETQSVIEANERQAKIDAKLAKQASKSLTIEDSNQTNESGKHSKTSSIDNSTNGTTKTEKRLLKSKDTISLSKGKDKTSGKKIVAKIDGICEFTIFSTGLLQQTIVDYLKSKYQFTELDED